MNEPLSADNISDLARYYDKEIEPKSEEIINLLIPIKENDVQSLDSNVIQHSYV